MPTSRCAAAVPSRHWARYRPGCRVPPAAEPDLRACRRRDGGDPRRGRAPRFRLDPRHPTARRGRLPGVGRHPPKADADVPLCRRGAAPALGALSARMSGAAYGGTRPTRLSPPAWRRSAPRSSASVSPGPPSPHRPKRTAPRCRSAPAEGGCRRPAVRPRGRAGIGRGIGPDVGCRLRRNPTYAPVAAGMEEIRAEVERLGFAWTPVTPPPDDDGPPV